MNKNKKQMNFEDPRLCFRVPPDMKRWVDSKGGSLFLRKVLLAAYKQLEGKEFNQSVTV
jgi:hypothetical protein